MRGIDVSAWQEDINWQGLKDEGFGFVIVKLGQENSLSDTFCRQVNEAVANGMKVGVYYYSTANSEIAAIGEADFVVAQVWAYLGGCPELGVWYDVEDQVILDSGADITAICKAFIARVQAAGINYVGVYSSYNWLTNYIGALDSPLWVAQYGAQNDFAAENPNADVRLWQYTDHVSDDLPYDGNMLLEGWR